MNRLFEWYSGVPRYVLALALAEFKELGGNEDSALDSLVEELTRAINQASVMKIIHAHQTGSRDGEYSHRVLGTPNKILLTFNWHGRQVKLRTRCWTDLYRKFGLTRSSSSNLLTTKTMAIYADLCLSRTRTPRCGMAEVFKPVNLAEIR
jgi:hypothetical protein